MIKKHIFVSQSYLLLQKESNNSTLLFYESIFNKKNKNMILFYFSVTISVIALISIASTNQSLEEQ